MAVFFYLSLRQCQESKFPGGWRSTEYKFRTFSVGYFACAQYDVKSPIVGVADTSPTRRTRPFCRYRDISPVSAGESTPKEEAKPYVILNDSEGSHRKSTKHIQTKNKEFIFNLIAIIAVLVYNCNGAGATCGG